jgi:hypothetical protein
MRPQRPASRAVKVKRGSGAPATDGFRALLGDRRGSGKPRNDGPQELSPVDRARRFLDWAKRVHFEAEFDYLRAEREIADELDIKLVHGRWKDSQDGDDAPRTLPLIAIFHDDAVVGFWDVEVDHLLTYDPPGRRAAR